MTSRALPVTVFIACVYIFLLLPIAIVVIASFNAGEYLSFPPSGLSFRWYTALLRSASFTRSFELSILIGLLAATCASVIGTPAALFYVRYLRFGREQFRLTMLAPMLLPEVLTAIALLFFFNEFFGGTQNIVPLLLGHTVITTPFVFLTVTSELYNMPIGVEEAARVLGARSWTAFRRVTFPLMKSGIISGAMLAFIMSFDNVNMSLMLKPIGVSTLPIQLFDYLRFDFDPTAAAVSTLSLTLTLLVVLAIDRVYGLRTVRF
jgi:putative spermidine/putrescine transport system permease protein